MHPSDMCEEMTFLNAYSTTQAVKLIELKRTDRMLNVYFNVLRKNQAKKLCTNGESTNADKLIRAGWGHVQGILPIVK